VLITSAARVEKVAGETGVEVGALAHEKCERCWHVRADVGADPAHPGLCGRCVSNLHGEGEPRAFA
jgi:isoleucyl-tRNA synthetase